MPTLSAVEKFRIVCLAGSAGGLQGYMDILREMPAETGMAFVVAPHRSFENAHLLPELLATVTTMPVFEVEQTMQVAANCVYIMPPRTNMTTDGNVFILRNTSSPPGWPKTINAFLCSLAESAGDRAVAVILSGLDHDGSAALRTVKSAGGLTFAQSDASVPDMPRHAVETGHVDYVLPAVEIAKAISALTHTPIGDTPMKRL